MSGKILLVDDDEDIIELLTYNLKKEGYKVKSANNGLKGIEKAASFMPDIILMDIMMPVLDGIEAGRQIKEDPNLKGIHIIYLTARAEEFSEIAAFEAGADDYITKPIKPRPLISRIKAHFRKGFDKNSEEDILEIGGLIINRLNYSVTKENGDEIVLPKKEFQLLFQLAKKPDNVHSRTELLHKIWGADVYVVERTVDVHIRKVREKLGDNVIKTLKGLGYMFNSK
ncbi:response regulator transcription factor [Arcticibacterium luteifluviistationis]|uniref:DNA-binding response regulator n=1 Tax=Arcticibacterium luteifluviistationis TaxID=1784714 RepID=A0A2Z4GCH9_9BACT|nr:response regulator transcription factor [Arcticibacterium luteifluviistationis]AWV98936.1 DNA-binding response regulator [Arcticibacterium luteifluviistationis]